MDKVVSVLHKGAIADYFIEQAKNNCFIARLKNYRGNKGNQPPEELSLHKEGRHWEDDGAAQDLVDDLGYSIEYDQRSGESGPVSTTRDDGRERNGGKP